MESGNKIKKKKKCNDMCYCRVLYTCGIIPCSLFITAGSHWMYQDSITHLLYHSVFTSRTCTSFQSTLWSSSKHALLSIAEVSMFPCSTARFQMHSDWFNKLYTTCRDMYALQVWLVDVAWEIMVAVLEQLHTPSLPCPHTFFTSSSLHFI